MVFIYVFKRMAGLYHSVVVPWACSHSPHVHRSVIAHYISALTKEPVEEIEEDECHAKQENTDADPHANQVAVIVLLVVCRVVAFLFFGILALLIFKYIISPWILLYKGSFTFSFKVWYIIFF